MARSRTFFRRASGSAWLALLAAPLAAQTVAPVAEPETAAEALPMAVHGRVVEREDDEGRGVYVRQWPGSYFETAFTGTAALFRIGAGKANYRIGVDGAFLRDLETPAPGLYRIAGLTEGRHVLRVDVISESQSEATAFGGFTASPGTRPAPLGSRARQIEIVGDSHSVGYGNRLEMQDCTQAQVFASTDAGQSPGALLARQYDADYRIDAISGRGVVRNYNGTAADTLPQAWPFALFDHAKLTRDPAWNPRLAVISLGTNDFSTPLHAGEKWADRAALHADYEASFVGFLGTLRTRFPHAFLLLWATELADGEIASEADKVVERMRAAGERRIAFVPVTDLSFSACHGHPDLTDDRAIAATLAEQVDARPDIWR